MNLFFVLDLHESWPSHSSLKHVECVETRASRHGVAPSKHSRSDVFVYHVLHCRRQFFEMSQYENSTDPAFRSEVNQVFNSSVIFTNFRCAPRAWLKYGPIHTTTSSSSSLAGGVRPRRTRTRIRHWWVIGINSDLIRNDA